VFYPGLLTTTLNFLILIVQTKGFVKALVYLVVILDFGFRIADLSFRNSPSAIYGFFSDPNHGENSGVSVKELLKKDFALK